MKVLGIDTSCDETSVALLDDGKIAANVIVSQTALHKPFGGVVPEIAARAHVERLIPALDEVLEGVLHGAAPDLIAVTNRPGLIGPLLVGVSAAKSLAFARGVPIVGVHHIEAHVSAAYLLDPPPEAPFVALIASGGHTLLIHVPKRGEYIRLGGTIDDAAGECFDKIAAILGLPYPGGPSVEKAARDGDAKAFDLPRPLFHKKNDDFSFSGLKTAVLYKVKGPGGARTAPNVTADFPIADMAASAQESIADVLSVKAIRACVRLGVDRIVLGGGVAANTRVRELIEERARAKGIVAFIPPKVLCTDNAAMIAARGAELYAEGVRDNLHLDADPYADQ